MNIIKFSIGTRFYFPPREVYQRGCVSVCVSWGGGVSPIWFDRDVPPVSAGFSMKNSLKTGMKFEKIKIKAGLQAKIGQNSVVKTNFALKLSQFSAKILR